MHTSSRAQAPGISTIYFRQFRYCTVHFSPLPQIIYVSGSMISGEVCDSLKLLDEADGAEDHLQVLLSCSGPVELQRCRPRVESGVSPAPAPVSRNSPQLCQLSGLQQLWQRILAINTSQIYAAWRYIGGDLIELNLRMNKEGALCVGTEAEGINSYCIE